MEKNIVINYNSISEFKKFCDTLVLEDHKLRIFRLWQGLNETSRKVLYSYLSYEPSNKKIREILTNNGGLLVLNGLTKMLFDRENGVFTFDVEFYCENRDCVHYDEPLITNKNYYKKCPKCDNSKLKIGNFDKLKDTFNGFYLSRFAIFYLESEKTCTYLIFDKYKNTFELKKGNDNLGIHLEVKLRNYLCPIESFMVYLSGNSKSTIKTLLVNYLNAENLIGSLSNLNFRPTNEKIFTYENN
jgi:hypothetical protein